VFEANAIYVGLPTQNNVKCPRTYIDNPSVYLWRRGGGAVVTEKTAVVLKQLNNFGQHWVFN